MVRSPFLTDTSILHLYSVLRAKRAAQKRGAKGLEELKDWEGHYINKTI